MNEVKIGFVGKVHVSCSQAVQEMCVISLECEVSLTYSKLHRSVCLAHRRSTISLLYSQKLICVKHEEFKIYEVSVQANSFSISQNICNEELLNWNLERVSCTLQESG